MSRTKTFEYEELLDFIARELGEPLQRQESLDGATVFVAGDPGEVIVRCRKSSVSVAVYAVRWRGPHTPIVVPREFAKLAWNRLPQGALVMTLHALIAAAREVRRSEFRKCRMCGDMNPPEWMHSKDICQGCAERHLGVVH